MLQCETSISQFDPAVFFLRKDGLLQGVVALHADDFRCTEECEEKVVTKLREICQEGKKESISFKFLVGFGLKSDKAKIFLSQNQYIANIQPAVLSIKSRRQNKRNTLTDTEHKSIRSLIGKSLWASSQTQPYVALKA